MGVSGGCDLVFRKSCLAQARHDVTLELFEVGGSVGEPRHESLPACNGQATLCRDCAVTRFGRLVNLTVLSVSRRQKYLHPDTAEPFGLGVLATCNGLVV